MVDTLLLWVGAVVGVHRVLGSVPSTQEVEMGKSAPAELHSKFKAILGYMRLFL